MYCYMVFSLMGYIRPKPFFFFLKNNSDAEAQLTGVVE